MHLTSPGASKGWGVLTCARAIAYSRRYPDALDGYRAVYQTDGAIEAAAIHCIMLEPLSLTGRCVFKHTLDEDFDLTGLDPSLYLLRIHPSIESSQTLDRRVFSKQDCTV
jgi:hypothetical protein